MTLATKITLARILLIIPTVALYIVGMLVDAVYLPLLITSYVDTYEHPYSLMVKWKVFHILPAIVQQYTHTSSHLSLD